MVVISKAWINKGRGRGGIIARSTGYKSEEYTQEYDKITQCGRRGKERRLKRKNLANRQCCCPIIGTISVGYIITRNIQ